MAQEASSVFEEVSRDHTDFWNETLSLNRDGEHVLTNTGQVDHKYHVVDLGEAGNEFNLDFGGFIALQTAFVVNKFEFLVKRAAISRHTDRVVDVDL